MAAPLPTPSGVVRTRFVHSLTDASDYGFAFDQSYTGGTPAVTDLNTLATSMREAYAAHLAPLLSSAFSLVRTNVVDLQHPTTVNGEDLTVVDGTRSGNSQAASLCTTIVYTPDRRYRGSRPKSFTPFGVEGDLATNQHWGSAWLTTVETAWAAFQTAVTGLTFGPCDTGAQASVSYIGPPYAFVPGTTPGRGRIEGTPRDPPIVLSITAVTVSTKIGSQRRRLGKPF